MGKLKVIVASFLLLCALSLPVYANSLDDVVGGGRDDVGVEDSVEPGGSGYTEGIKDAGNLSANLGEANKVAEPLKTGVGFVVGVIATAIPLLLVLRVMLDLLYIFIPFSRGLLGGGAQPAAGGMGGFGGGGFGGGGFGGGMSGGMSGGQGQGGRIQWVSNQAMNAVAMESGQQSSGGGFGGGGFGGGFGGGGAQQAPVGSAFKLYSKDMVITLTIAPIMLILAISGVLTSLGTALGQAAVGIIQNLIGMI